MQRGEGDQFRETLVPPLPAERIATVDDVHDESSDEVLVDVTTRTLRNWIEASADQLEAETGEEGWSYLGFHDLRRTWASQLRSADVDAMVVCDWGGWTNLQTFLEHYRGTATPEAQLREREKVDWLRLRTTTASDPTTTRSRSISPTPT